MDTNDRLSALRGYMRRIGITPETADFTQFERICDEYFGTICKEKTREWYLNLSDGKFMNLYRQFVIWQKG